MIADFEDDGVDNRSVIDLPLLLAIDQYTQRTALKSPLQLYSIGRIGACMVYVAYVIRVACVVHVASVADVACEGGLAGVASVAGVVCVACMIFSPSPERTMS